MRQISKALSLIVFIVFAGALGASAQSGPSGAPANAKAIQPANATPKFRTVNRLSAATKAALQTDGDANGNGERVN